MKVAVLGTLGVIFMVAGCLSKVGGLDWSNSRDVLEGESTNSRFNIFHCAETSQENGLAITIDSSSSINEDSFSWQKAVKGNPWWELSLESMVFNGVKIVGSMTGTP